MKPANEPLPFETRILTGITIRNAFWITTGLISILVTIITTYASIMNKLDKSQEAIIEMRRVKEVTDMQIKTIEVQLQTIEIRLVRLETQLKTQN
jgi:hypothetical protein